MTVTEFEETYYLHDSMIEKIEYDAENKTLRLEIDFCFWMQNWYNAEELPNGYIAVTFENVSRYEYEYHAITKVLDNLNTEIRSTKVDAGTLSIFMWENIEGDDDDIYPELKICAENVTVAELKRYNV